MKRVETKKTNIKKASDDVASKRQGLQSPSQSSEAFSVLEKLPSFIYFKNRYEDIWEETAPTAFLEINKSGFGQNDTVWLVAYRTLDGMRSVTFISEWLVGAATKMASWLIENNYKLDERK